VADRPDEGGHSRILKRSNPYRAGEVFFQRSERSTDDDG